VLTNHDVGNRNMLCSYSMRICFDNEVQKVCFGCQVQLVLLFEQVQIVVVIRFTNFRLRGSYSCGYQV
jgi:hypothetical protein